MIRRAAAFLTLFLALMFAGLASAQNAHLRESVLSDANAVEQRLRTTGSLFGTSVRRGASDGYNDVLRKLQAPATAARTEPRNAERWIAVARVALRGVDDVENYGEKYDLRELATAAAALAAQRANGRPQEARALALLGEVYASNSAWRPALDAYRASLERADNAQVKRTYEQLREEHGFKLTDYKVDADGATPRVCFTFSEPLSRTVADFSPYIVVQGADKPAVVAETSQICVEGLRHGSRYSFVVRQGLPSAVGENLLKAADYEVYVRDRSPQLRFTGRNYVLPRVGQEGIPLVSVNASKAEIDIYRFGDRSLLSAVQSDDFLKQLELAQAKRIGDQRGIKVWSGRLDIKAETNKDVITAFPVQEAVGKLEPGLYVMTARTDRKENDDADDYESVPTQWFVVSDLGLTALMGDDGVHVLVRSLASAEPLANVELRLIAKSNEVLGTVVTDQDGKARFDAGLARGKGGLAPGMVVAQDKGGDYGFLDLAQNAFDLSDRGVKGREAPKGLDAFVFTERGVYRGGETVFLTAMLRDAAGIAHAGLPLTVVAKRPDGVEYKRAVVRDQGLGGISYSLALISGAARGTWTVQLYADPKGRVLGETRFLVEDYVPERLELTLTPRADAYKIGQAAELDVLARYLYGAPGAELQVTGETVLRLADKVAIPGLPPGYTIGIDDEEFEAKTNEFSESFTTDEQGKALVSVELPTIETTRPVEARFRVRVGETGGRSIERAVTVPILPNGPVIAIKKNFDDKTVDDEGNVSFDILAVTPDGARIARKGATWKLSRIERRYQWQNNDGRWGYEVVKTSRKVRDGSIDIETGQPARVTVPVRWGAYRFEVVSGDQTTSVTFYAGWSGEPTADTPDLLDVALDKPSYTAGDKVDVRVKPGFAGKATVAIVSDKVQAWRVVDVTPEGATASFTADAAWGPGAYAVAFAHRPLDGAAKRMPGRAIGVAWFQLDRDARAIDIEVGTAEKIRPRGVLDIPIKLAGLQPGEEAYVTVSAVDIGILNLTRYETPKPGPYFFGQRQLGTEIRDLYGLLIDGMQGTRGQIRSGGDAAAGEGTPSPPREAPLARYSGVVRVGPDGTAKVTFDIPGFDGSVRVAVHAWAKSRVGHAQKDVIIRDPVVMQSTLPRFLSLGDQTRFHVQIDNVEGRAGAYQLDLDIAGPLVVATDAASRRLDLTAGGRAQLSIPVTAAGLGDARIDVRLSGQGIQVVRSLPIRVQPGTASLVRRTVQPLAAGARVTLSSDLVADLVPGTGSVSTTVAPIGAFDVGALLRSLDRYPYGCTEQTVSRALPLLYVNQLASRELLSLDDKIDDRVREAIDRVVARQDSNGSFGLWGVGGDDMWLDAFVADFLTRARERNFAVPERAFGLVMDRLRNHVANTTEVKDGGEDLAYAIYVLARNGRPVMGDLRYLADTKIGSFGTPLARAQIAAALALLGDRPRADAALTSAVGQLAVMRDQMVSRSDYGSRLRDGAGILALAAETNLDVAQIQRASGFVEEARAAYRYTSTQENSWMVLAAQALARRAETLRLTVDGQPHRGSLYRTVEGDALELKPVVIGNEGSEPVRLVVSVQGNPIVPEPAEQRGYQIEREYYKLDGTKVALDQITQNDRMVVVLKVTETSSTYARLLLVDLLPAGLEIDNPKLVDGGSVEGLNWLTREVEPAHTEYRDDRFVAAFDRATGQKATFSVAYLVRAVSPGKFVHPPAIVEDMYRPDRFGRTAFGSLEVKPARP